MIKIVRKHFIIACVLIVAVSVSGYVGHSIMETAVPSSKDAFGEDRINLVRPLFAQGEAPTLIPALFPFDSDNSALTGMKVEKVGYDRKAAPGKRNHATGENVQGNNLPEFRRMRQMALELARKFPNTGKIKACYDRKNSEWWIVIYETSGSGLSLRQYIWPTQEDKPDPFLILKKIPKEKLDWHLKSSEPGRVCRVIDLDENKDAAADAKGPKSDPEKIDSVQSRPPDGHSGQAPIHRRESQSSNIVKNDPEKKADSKTVKMLKPLQPKAPTSDQISQKAVNSGSRVEKNPIRAEKKQSPQKQVTVKRENRSAPADSDLKTPQTAESAATAKDRKISSDRIVRQPERTPAPAVAEERPKADMNPLTSYVTASAPPVSPLITSDTDGRIVGPEKSRGINSGHAIPDANKKVASLPDGRYPESPLDGRISTRGPKGKQRIAAVADEVSEGRPASAVSQPQPKQEVPTTFVFVYGTGMNHAELLDWLKSAGYDSSLIIDAIPAVLDGYDFVWNYFSPSRGGGAVNLETSPGSRVWGLLLEFQDKALKAFDLKEGHPHYYARMDSRVHVRRSDNGKTEFAWLYLAKPNRHGRRNVWPTADYKNRILEAAMFWQFPNDYIDKIRSWNTQ